MATVLDPAFKFFWLRDLKLPAQIENRLKQNIIQMIIDEISKDSKTTRTQSHRMNFSFAETSSSSTSTPKTKRRKLFHYDDSSMDEPNESATLDPAVELDAYLNDLVRSKFSDY